MIYFYRRAHDSRSCETRIEPNGPGFDLIVTEGRDERVEHFDDAGELAIREHQLRHEWRLNGWREVEDDFGDDD
jgi:hypothetical protein